VVAQSTSSSQRALTTFEQALLGLIGLEPRTGYELKTLFRTTPAGVYEPSDGTLYPALRRLEQRGYLSAESVASGRRQRRRYHATGRGRAATLDWITEPVDPTLVGRDLAWYLMKFVLMEDILPAADVRLFLTDLAAALKVFLGAIEDHIASTDYPGRHPRLALEHGLAVQATTLTWVKHAIATLPLSRDPVPGEIP
jgi:DNA-binding PadR family transcriptional regulator